jgi:tRNA U55 pseudouridine synthase TruB
MSNLQHTKSQDSIVSELKAFEMEVSLNQSTTVPDQDGEKTANESCNSPNSRLHVSKRGFLSFIDTAVDD